MSTSNEDQAGSYSDKRMVLVATEYHEGYQRAYETWVNEWVVETLVSGTLNIDDYNGLDRLYVAPLVLTQSGKKTEWYVRLGPLTLAEIEERYAMETRSAVQVPGVSAHTEEGSHEGLKNCQMVLIRTDCHNVDHEPDEQWICRGSACAFLLHQQLKDMAVKTDLEKKLEELLWEQCKAWRWSKWDFRSTWYLKDLKDPVDYDTRVEVKQPDTA